MLGCPSTVLQAPTDWQCELAAAVPALHALAAGPAQLSCYPTRRFPRERAHGLHPFSQLSLPPGDPLVNGGSSGLRAIVRHGLMLLICSAGVWAQAGDGGDDPGSVQHDLPSDLVVPTAPVLSPEEAMAAFSLADDLAVELVAAEPLIHDPVAACFDGEGRLWVCEMRGFMPDADGLGEDAPVGSVVVLHDDDGDGTMDRRVVFLDELVLPRGVLPVRGGALVIAPPEVLFCRDTDGDGRADERTVVESGVSGLVSPEHALNGLLATLDNRIAVANHPRSYRWSEGAWVTEANTPAGQWGQTMDDWGRLYFNTNSDVLRAHAVAPRYGVRNRNHGTIAGLNKRVVEDQGVWPVRITPGVNRGYRPGVLKDWKLSRVTAACAPLVHRGDGLPDGYGGAAFVCEPAANLVQHYALWDDEQGSPRGAPASPGQAVLASTDERFRPVDLLDGPDGAVYVVDMYRGILQHKIFMTTFLRRQVDRRGLAEPLGLGRIWRLVRKGERPTAADPLSQLTPLQAVARLEHSNGFLRDQAQQWLVERGADDGAIDEALSHMATTSSFGHARAHALWTLTGRGTLDPETLAAALTSPQPEARRAAAQVAEPWLLRRPNRFVPALSKLTRDEDVRVSRQALLSLGVDHPLAVSALFSAALADVSTAERRSAILCSVPGRELELFEGLLASNSFAEQAPGRDRLLFFLARAVAREGRSLRLDDMLVAVGDDCEPWQQQAVFEGLLAVREDPTERLAVRSEPAVLTRVQGGDDDGLADLARQVSDLLIWPGHPRRATVAEVAPLTDEQEQLFARGDALYAAVCLACHQASGRGAPGLAPPLRRSEHVLAQDPRRLAAILLHGLDGPLVVRNQQWSGDMPALAGDDRDLAAVLTYIRREWGHVAEPVSPHLVSETREATADRDEPWTWAELERAFP